MLQLSTISHHFNILFESTYFLSDGQVNCFRIFFVKAASLKVHMLLLYLLLNQFFQHRTNCHKQFILTASRSFFSLISFNSMVIIPLLKYLCSFVLHKNPQKYPLWLAEDTVEILPLDHFFVTKAVLRAANQKSSFDVSRIFIILDSSLKIDFS